MTILRAVVDGAAHAVEHAAQHVRADAKLHAVAQEADLALGQVDAAGAFEQLHYSPVAVHLQHLAAAGLAGGKLDLGQLVVGDAFHVLDHHQRA